ncbi:MAG: XdhC family protein [Chloroflexi bacterium]|nr:XdhC family protein [Chloroflexota bacterium]
MTPDVPKATDLTARSVQLLEAGAPFCLATVVAARGAAAPRPGAKLIVHPDGTAEGTLGAEALDRAVGRAALAQIEEGEVGVARFRTSGEPLPARRGMRDLERESDAVEVSLDPLLPPPKLIIVGAGHIAVPLARLAKILGFHVAVVDDRVRFANRERFPDADEIVVDAFDRAIAAQTITPWTYLVLVTRGHEHDEATLKRVVGSPAPYIGMIGSRRRVLVVFQRLAKAGVPERFLDRIYAPIGLDIGSRTAEEIALAIMAEIVNVRRRGRAPSLALRHRKAGSPAT